MKAYTYLLIDFFCLLIPFLCSFYPKQAFYKEWKFFLPANILVALLFIVWDYFFTEMSIWGFNEEYLLGLNFLNLPIEEVLFFICIPYACTFTFFAFKYLIRDNPLKEKQKSITGVLILALFVLGLVNYSKWYSASTFFCLGLVLVYFYLRKSDLAYEYLAYLAILPFFFISNGLLTGSFLARPIVWYNDAENLGIRMWTIPVEDIFYGFLLILLNLKAYQYFKRKFG